MKVHDAIVVGAGPNGLAAAIVLARTGLRVLVREGSATVGGGARSAALTLPGFVHDVCSAVHPMAAVSPFFRSLPLAEHGLAWIHPDAPLAHPFDDGPPVFLERSVDATASGLGADADAYRRLLSPLVNDWERAANEILAPVHVSVFLARFGLWALWPATQLTNFLFRGPRAKALFAGLAAHSIAPLESWGTSAIGLVLALAGHAAGWPVPRGGSQAIADALAAHFRSLGGEIETEAPVASVDDLPSSRAVLLDLTPRQVLSVAGSRLPAQYRRKLQRFTYGPGVFKMDWALSGPIPWRDPECARAGTVHLGGSAEEIAASESAAGNGIHAERPFVLLAQPSLFDPIRAPAGRHVAWAYCHVPHGSTEDMSARIEAQIERFAPGFRDVILARSTKNTADLERQNPNLVGGDIAGGANSLAQLLFRPVASFDPYRTEAEGLYICSASTPPGGGVHGMCGYHAAHSALKTSLYTGVS